MFWQYETELFQTTHFQIVKNLTSTYYHLFFPRQNLNLSHTHKTNEKIEDLGNARSPFDYHPFPTKQMQHKTIINDRATYLKSMLAGTVRVQKWVRQSTKVPTMATDRKGEGD